MPFKHGWSALHLEMPDIVPRTEYSVDSHWALINAVTGSTVSFDSLPDIRTVATQEFMKAWDYDFVWNVLISEHRLGNLRTKMGATYSAGGTDYADDIYCPFDEPEDVLKFDAMEKYGSIDIESGKKIMFTYDGNYTELTDDIAECGIHSFVLEPCTDMRYIAEYYGKTHAFVGNVDTRVLLSET